MRLSSPNARLVVLAVLIAAAACILYLTRSGGEGPVRARALHFEPVPTERIVDFYASRGSQLATREAATAILAAAWRHDVHPAVLIAITGQEQSFVPLGDDPRIALNPFNVYGCWCDTDIPLEESAQVAAATVATRLQCLPERPRSNLIVWINSKANPCVREHGVYAVHRGWGPGVAKLFRDVVAPALGVDPQLARSQ